MRPVPECSFVIRWTSRLAIMGILLAGLSLKVRASEERQTAVGRPGKVVLAFAPPPGSVLMYDFVCLVSSQTSSFDGGNFPFQAVARGDIRMDVRSSRSEGVTIFLSSPGIEVSYFFRAETDKFRLRVPENDPVRMVFTRTGRILDVRNGDALEKKNRINFSILDMIGFCFPSLPDGPRTIGDSWTEKRRLQLPFQGITLAVDLNLNYSFNDLAWPEKGRLAVLMASPVVNVLGTGETNELSGTVRGKGSGTAQVQLLVDQGIIEQYHLDTQIQGKILVRSQGITLFEWPLTMALSFRLNRRDMALFLP